MESRIILSLLILFSVSTQSLAQSRHMMLRDADIAYKNKMYKEVRKFDLETKNNYSFLLENKRRIENQSESSSV